MRHLFIINPAAGKKESTRQLEERIAQLSIPHEVVYTKRAGDAERITRQAAADGEPLLKASALWSLVDAQTRRVVFPEKYGVVIEGVMTGGEIAMPGAVAKGACRETRDFTVPYSFVDLNGHMNNTRYFDLAEDCAGAAAAGRLLKSIAVEYQNEARLGETLHLAWGGEDGVYLCGETERPVFRMRLEYR